jgi:hypothetical protein
MVCLRRVVLGGSVFLFQGYCMLSNKLLVKNISYSEDASLQCSIIYSINRLRAFTQVIHYFISTSLHPIHYFIQSTTSSNPLLHPIHYFIQSTTSSNPLLHPVYHFIPSITSAIHHVSDQSIESHPFRPDSFKIQ